MDYPNDLAPRDFLRLAAFSPERAHVQYRNARRHLLGGLFISHSDADSRKILDHIVPIVSRRLPFDGCFLHSRSSGGAAGYRELVQAALHWCDKFMVVISQLSIANEWVQAEIEWALERSRPILAVHLEELGWDDLFRMLKLSPNIEAHQVQCFNFGNDLEQAQRQLTAALDELVANFPYRGELPAPDVSPL
jgi:hypothetical protein